MFRIKTKITHSRFNIIRYYLRHRCVVFDDIVVIVISMPVLYAIVDAFLSSFPHTDRLTKTMNSSYWLLTHLHRREGGGALLCAAIAPIVI